MNQFVRNMNLDNLRPGKVRRLISIIRDFPQHFNMSSFMSVDGAPIDYDAYIPQFVVDNFPHVDSFFHACGTTACIAGYAAICQLEENPGEKTMELDMESLLSDYIGIKVLDAMDIAGSVSPWEKICRFTFGGYAHRYWRNEITPDHAVTLLQSILDEYKSRIR